MTRYIPVSLTAAGVLLLIAAIIINDPEQRLRPLAYSIIVVGVVLWAATAINRRIDDREQLETEVAWLRTRLEAERNKPRVQAAPIPTATTTNIRPNPPSGPSRPGVPSPRRSSDGQRKKRHLTVINGGALSAFIAGVGVAVAKTRRHVGTMARQGARMVRQQMVPVATVASVAVVSPLAIPAITAFVAPSSPSSEAAFANPAPTSTPDAVGPSLSPESSVPRVDPGGDATPGTEEEPVDDGLTLTSVDIPVVDASDDAPLPASDGRPTDRFDAPDPGSGPTSEPTSEPDPDVSPEPSPTASPPPAPKPTPTTPIPTPSPGPDETCTPQRNILGHVIGWVCELLTP